MVLLGSRYSSAVYDYRVSAHHLSCAVRSSFDYGEGRKAVAEESIFCRESILLPTTSVVTTNSPSCTALITSVMSTNLWSGLSAEMCTM